MLVDAVRCYQIHHCILLFLLLILRLRLLLLPLPADGIQMEATDSTASSRMLLGLDQIGPDRTSWYRWIDSGWMLAGCWMLLDGVETC